MPSSTKVPVVYTVRYVFSFRIFTWVVIDGTHCIICGARRRLDTGYSVSTRECRWVVRFL